MSWSSVDPRTGQVVTYQPADNATLEAAYQANPRGNCVLTFPWGVFTVDFMSMRQVNATGGSRSVRRVDPNASATGMSGASSSSFSASRRDEDAAASPPGPLPDLSDAIVAAARAAVTAMDQMCERLEAKERDALFRTSAAAAQLPLDEAQVRAVLAVYEHIIADLNDPELRKRFGYNPSEVGHLYGHREGEPVPEYFANVSGGQSIFYRKLVSLLGMRNLVRGGLKVFASMLAQLFIGNVDAYGPREGPQLMKYLTGNVVDLDTVVLRCSDPVQLRVINEMLRKQEGASAAQFSSADQLAGSTFGMQMAHSQTQRLIEQFVERFALTPSDISRRCLALPSAAPRSLSEVRTATNNGDRGRAPMWLYRNAGVVSYHANVPAMADIYGALLRAPYHFVKAYLIAKVNKKGTPSALTEFFEDALADTCFNQKWQAVESYLSARSREGAIFHVLSQYQATRQDVFTTEFYARDDRAGRMELDMMIALVATQRPPLMGVDPLTCQYRAIDAADVRAWHKAVVLASV